jgi:hypothetical protein
VSSGAALGHDRELPSEPEITRTDDSSYPAMTRIGNSSYSSLEYSADVSEPGAGEVSEALGDVSPGYRRDGSVAFRFCGHRREPSSSSPGDVSPAPGAYPSLGADCGGRGRQEGEHA